MRVRLKNSGVRCRLTNIKPETLFAMWALREALSDRGIRTMRFTSCTDAIEVHGPKSKHPLGYAFDLDADQIDPILIPGLLAEVREDLGPDFDILEEAAGTPSHHIHVEFDPERD